MKDTLIIYRDWWEAIKNLPPELQFEAFDAICAYAFEGKQPENPIISAVTALMRSAVDRDKTKWEDVREKRRQAGKRGLAKRWGEKKESPDTMANDSKNSNCQQMPTIATPTEPKPTPTPNKADIELEKEFDIFREMYPGQKRGLAVELGNLKKKYPKEWKKIIPLLRPAVERLIDYHQRAEAAKASGAQIFVPNYAYLQTWINQARWQEEFPELPATGSTSNNAPSAIEEPDYDDTDFGGRKY